MRPGLGYSNWSWVTKDKIKHRRQQVVDVKEDLPEATELESVIQVEVESVKQEPTVSTNVTTLAVPSTISLSNKLSRPAQTNDQR